MVFQIHAYRLVPERQYLKHLWEQTDKLYTVARNVCSCWVRSIENKNFLRCELHAKIYLLGTKQTGGHTSIENLPSKTTSFVNE